MCFLCARLPSSQVLMCPSAPSLCSSGLWITFRPHQRLHKFGSESVTVQRSSPTPQQHSMTQANCPPKPPRQDSDPAPELIQSSRLCYKLSLSHRP